MTRKKQLNIKTKAVLKRVFRTGPLSYLKVYICTEKRPLFKVFSLKSYHFSYCNASIVNQHRCSKQIF